MSRCRAAALSTVRWAAALTAVGTLAGCASLHPGVAIEAGGQTITLSEVDDITRDVCTVIQSDQRSKGVYPMDAIRRGVVRSLALRSVAEQLAEQYDVAPGSSYTTSVKLYDRNLATVSQDVREHAISVLTTPDYVQGIVDAIGAVELHNAGMVNPSTTETSDKGQSILLAWTVEHGVEIDPRFDLALSDTGIDSVHNDTSYATSEFATQAAADQPSEAFVAALPPSQRCG